MKLLHTQLVESWDELSSKFHTHTKSHNICTLFCVATYYVRNKSTRSPCNGEKYICIRVTLPPHCMEHVLITNTEKIVLVQITLRNT